MNEQNMTSGLELPADDPTQHLIDMTNQHCLVALDKTLAAIARSRCSYAAAAARVSSIGERCNSAARSVGLQLPQSLRV